MIDFLIVIIELFYAICYGGDVINENLSKSATRRFLKGVVVVVVLVIALTCVVSTRGWVNLSANLRRKGAWPTTHRWCQKTRAIANDCHFVRYHNIGGALFDFVTKAHV